jgi:hypothetical protein
MYARAVDQAALELRELRREELGDFGLAGVALVLAVAASELRPTLALPLLLGSLVVLTLGLRAFWRRWDLVDRLAGERDAYAISEVLAYATREASLERRRDYAAVIRRRLDEDSPTYDARLAPVAGDLGALASDLEDAALALEPECAVACSRLATEPEESALLNRAFRPEDLRARVSTIRAGFHPSAGD